MSIKDILIVVFVSVFALVALFICAWYRIKELNK